MGVDIFFILSGFVLSYVYAHKFNTRDFQSYSHFLKARIARIYPLHVVTLCVLGVIVLSAPEHFMRYPIPEQRWGIGSFFASLFLIQTGLIGCLHAGTRPPGRLVPSCLPISLFQSFLELLNDGKERFYH